MSGEEGVVGGDHSFSGENQRHLSKLGGTASKSGTERPEGGPALSGQGGQEIQLAPQAAEAFVYAGEAQNSWRVGPDIQGREWDRAE